MVKTSLIKLQMLDDQKDSSAGENIFNVVEAANSSSNQDKNSSGMNDGLGDFVRFNED